MIILHVNDKFSTWKYLFKEEEKYFIADYNNLNYYIWNSKKTKNAMVQKNYYLLTWSTTTKIITMQTDSLPSECVSLVNPPMASFALRWTARELTWYPLVELTPSEVGIA